MSIVIGPQSLIAALRKHALPSPGDLIRQLQHGELMRMFRDLVMQWLPEHQAEIFSAGNGHYGENAEAQRCYAFVEKFGEKYFPINEFEEIEYLLWGPQYQHMGWTYDDFHQVDQWQPHFQMLLTLVESPYDWQDRLADGDYVSPGEAGFSVERDVLRPRNVSGTRLVLMEELEPVVGKDLLRRLPPPMTPEQLHKRLDGTPYAAAAEFADWTWGQTGTAFLDMDPEVEDGEDQVWDEATIQMLTQHWQRTKQILDRIDALSAQLKANPKEHFAALIAAASKPHPSESPSATPEGMPLVEVLHLEEIADRHATPEDAENHRAAAASPGPADRQHPVPPRPAARRRGRPRSPRAAA